MRALTIPIADNENQDPPVIDPSQTEESSGEEEISEAASSHEENLGQNLDEFKKMTIELTNAGDNEKLSDENEAILLLNSLLKSFKDVKATIKYSRSSLTLEECISALKSKDLERRIEKKDRGENLFARERQLRSSIAHNTVALFIEYCSRACGTVYRTVAALLKYIYIYIYFSFAYAWLLGFRFSNCGLNGF
ncbi:hypothetical protein EZV62_007358 [Acer yangbiense]|uniref:Uncharacterized protein n=1 Tax=Acer yangbiense TaxID=1000413 RepID=A0A5C7I908_9ROSI|nr:hypothetical protein EZV62_007358 [Acer yangbiense]